MIYKYMVLWISFFVLCALGQFCWLNWLSFREVAQIQKSYGPKRAEAKWKTPAMGGVVFMVAALPAVVAGWSIGDGSLFFQLGIWSLPLGAGVIGLWDDLLKFKKGSSEGLSSIQKLMLQVFLALLWSTVMAYFGSLHILPHRIFSFPGDVLLVSFLIVSMLNAVNVTDGLDGLAAGASAISLLFLGFLVSRGFSAIAIGLSITISFLWHNAYPAKIFMGDSGSHFLGGLLVSVAVCGGGALFVVPCGALFGIEILSVAIQIVAIRFFGKKVFMMSPVHHHFEILGWNETQIVVRFWIVHLLGISTLLLTGKLILSAL